MSGEINTHFKSTIIWKLKPRKMPYVLHFLNVVHVNGSNIKSSSSEESSSANKDVENKICIKASYKPDIQKSTLDNTGSAIIEDEGNIKNYPSKIESFSENNATENEKCTNAAYKYSKSNSKGESFISGATGNVIDLKEDNVSHYSAKEESFYYEEHESSVIVKNRKSNIKNYPPKIKSFSENNATENEKCTNAAYKYSKSNSKGKSFISSTTGNVIDLKEDNGSHYSAKEESFYYEEHESSVIVKNRKSSYLRCKYRRGKYSREDFTFSYENAKNRHVTRVKKTIKTRHINISKIVSPLDYAMMRNRGLLRRDKYKALISYLHDLYKRELICSLDLFDSRDPLIRACAYDAMTRDVDEQISGRYKFRKTLHS